MAHTSFPEAGVVHSDGTVAGAQIRRGGALMPRVAAPAKARSSRATLLRCLGLGLAWFAAGCFLLVGLAAAYTLKRALNLDIVPGVDMLPDPEIEAAIHAVLVMLGFV